MALFQKSVLNKYLKQQDDVAVEKAYKKFVKYFFNPITQQNIREINEEGFQQKFLMELFVTCFGYVINPDPDYNLTTEFKNLKDAKKADSVVGMGKSNQNHGDRYIKQLKVRSFELEYHDENVLLLNLDMLDTGLGFTIKDTANERDLVNGMVDRSERNQEIIKLSYKSYSGSQIAEKLGMGKSQVNAIIKRHKDGKEE